MYNNKKTGLYANPILFSKPKINFESKLKKERLKKEKQQRVNLRNQYIKQEVDNSFRQSEESFLDTFKRRSKAIGSYTCLVFKV